MTTPPATSRNSLNRNLAIAGLFMAASFALLIWLDLTYIMPLKKLDIPNVDNDLSNWWTASRTIWQGGNPYDYAPDGLYRRIAAAEGGELLTFVNPFYLTLIFMPFAALPLKLAALLWLVISQLLLGLTVAFVLKVSRVSLQPGAFLAGLALALLWRYSFEVMILNNVSILMGFAAAASFYWNRRGRPYLSGAAAALLLLKPQIVFLLVPALLVLPGPDETKAGSSGWLSPAVYRRWAGFAAVAGVFALYSFALRPGWVGEWLGMAGEKIDPSFNSEMTSLRSIVALFTSDNRWVQAGYLVVLAAGTAGLVALWWVNRASRADAPYVLSVFIVGNLLLAPYTRSYDFCLLLFPLLFCYFTMRRLEIEEGRAKDKTGFRWSLLWWPLLIIPWPLHLVAVSTTFAWENLVLVLLLALTLVTWRRDKKYGRADGP